MNSFELEMTKTNLNANIEKAYIDGYRLYMLFIAGAYRIIQNREFLNKINYFPVPDSDTGTNLAGTLNYMIENTSAKKSISEMANDLAETALDGARGNSGNIFAQFFMGLADSIKENIKIDINQLNKAIFYSVKSVYQSLSKPVEGTILTIMNDFSKAFDKLTKDSRNIHTLMDNIMTRINLSLEETSKAMKKLKFVDVVDAGAKGFALFLEGIHDLFVKGPTYVKDLVKQIKSSSNKYLTLDTVEHDFDQELPEFRYCTEGKMIIKNEDEIPKLRKDITEFGDSIVFTFFKNKVKFHIHTNKPDELFFKIKSYGDIIYQKADDMQRQYIDAHKKTYKIALLTDSVADLPQELIDKYNIHVVPIYLNFDQNQYLDKLTLKTKQLFKNIDYYPIYPKSAAPSISFLERYYAEIVRNYDSIISIHVTNKFSVLGTNSKKAAENISKKFNKRIDVIDSKQLSGSLGLIVEKAGKFIKQGFSQDRIIREINKIINDINIYVSLKTLKYMVKGGRVSPMKGKIANFLNARPIVSMGNGDSKIFSAAFTQNSLTKKIIKLFLNRNKKQEIKEYSIVHSANYNYAKHVENEIYKLTGKKANFITEISAIVASHAGKGAIAISYY